MQVLVRDGHPIDQFSTRGVSLPRIEKYAQAGGLYSVSFYPGALKVRPLDPTLRRFKGSNERMLGSYAPGKLLDSTKRLGQ